ncbi:hypothetical protein GHT06_004414 [Daphnia sinensis]|uniref:Uncharacterized protein n=1 Tax=Daphnia sinensis TaxID=1820382 RepID=A0AAD5KUI0_9CRUS|nr:hypothetical protein GHT06_004414 [Daphnia sinensis]
MVVKCIVDTCGNCRGKEAKELRIILHELTSEVVLRDLWVKAVRESVWLLFRNGKRVLKPNEIPTEFQLKEKTAGPTVKSNMNLKMPSITLQQSPMVVKTAEKVTSPISVGVQDNSLRFPTGDFLLPNVRPALPEVVKEWCSSTSCQNMKFTHLDTLLGETWLDDLIKKGKRYNVIDDYFSLIARRNKHNLAYPWVDSLVCCFIPALKAAQSNTNNAHWALVSVSCREKIITYYDSLKGNDRGTLKMLHDLFLSTSIGSETEDWKMEVGQTFDGMTDNIHHLRPTMRRDLLEGKLRDEIRAEDPLYRERQSGIHNENLQNGEKKFREDHLKQKLMNYIKLEDQMADGDVCATFIINQCENINKKKYTWSVEVVKQCIVLQARAPGIYEYLRRNRIMLLPSRYTLRTYIGRSTGEVGVTGPIRQRLQVERENIFENERYITGNRQNGNIS